MRNFLLTLVLICATSFSGATRAQSDSVECFTINELLTAADSALRGQACCAAAKIRGLEAGRLRTAGDSLAGALVRQDTLIMGLDKKIALMAGSLTTSNERLRITNDKLSNRDRRDPWIGVAIFVLGVLLGKNL